MKVPDGKVGTDVRKYGQLAGKYVPGPVWNDVRNMGDELFHQPGRQGIRLASEQMEGLENCDVAAVHVNNIMSNFVFMNWADDAVNPATGSREDRCHDGQERRRKALWESFKTHGGDSGAYAFHELQQGELESLLKSLESRR